MVNRLNCLSNLYVEQEHITSLNSLTCGCLLSPPKTSDSRNYVCDSRLHRSELRFDSGEASVGNTEGLAQGNLPRNTHRGINILISWTILPIISKCTSKICERNQIQYGKVKVILGNTKMKLNKKIWKRLKLFIFYEQINLISLRGIFLFFTDLISKLQWLHEVNFDFI